MRRASILPAGTCRPGRRRFRNLSVRSRIALIFCISGGSSSLRWRMLGDALRQLRQQVRRHHDAVDGREILHHNRLFDRIRRSRCRGPCTAVVGRFVHARWRDHHPGSPGIEGGLAEADDRLGLRVARRRRPPARARRPSSSPSPSPADARPHSAWRPRPAQPRMVRPCAPLSN